MLGDEGEAGGATADAKDGPSYAGAGGDGFGEGGAAVVDCDDRPTESVTLDQPIWQTGFKVTLGTAVLTPATASCSPGTLIVDAEFENRSGQTVSFSARTLLSSAGRDYELSAAASEIPDVPGGRKGKGTLAFTVDRGFAMDDAVLTFGGAERHQATIALAPESTVPTVTLEPQALPLKGKIVAGNLTLTFDGAYLAADAFWDYESLAEDELALRIDFGARNDGTYAGGLGLDSDNLSLQLPDGTSIAPTDGPNEAIYDIGTTVPDLWARFIIPTPAAGEYKLIAGGRWAGDINSNYAEAELAIVLPSFPTFGDD